MSLRDTVLAALDADLAMSREQLVDETGLDVKQVSNALDQCQRAGRCKRTPEGWLLTRGNGDAGPAELPARAAEPDPDPPKRGAKRAQRRGRPPKAGPSAVKPKRRPRTARAAKTPPAHRARRENAARAPRAPQHAGAGYQRRRPPLRADRPRRARDRRCGRRWRRDDPDGGRGAAARRLRRSSAPGA